MRALLALCAAPMIIMSAPLDPDTASRFARLALRCIQQEYPNKLDHVINDAAEVRSPRDLHPAFYGCFDWHSSVHGHWMLVRVLRTHPNLDLAPAIRRALDANLTAAHLRTEAAYFHQKNRGSFERTYGWAWLLKLAEELRAWKSDPDAQRWSTHVQPLADEIVARYLAFLPKQLYPIRTGVHPNTAFGLAFAWDYAQATNHEPLKQLIAERARFYFLADTNYPAILEPSGADFFSPALMEADLLRRVLPPTEFARWYARFLPTLPRQLTQPATVTDRTDLQIVHLDGLNLSRAWCLRSLANALPAQRAQLTAAADRHAAAGLQGVTAGDYAGEHWLASFAVYLLTN
ncbi:MAG: DUF2891 domain-containing protein [Bryobacteraceae bacterium]|nr:DUF2891 domain-containing protein [Bryobacteraceae bacterium]